MAAPKWPLSPRHRVRDRRPARRPVVFRDPTLGWTVRFRDGRYQTTQLVTFPTHAAAIVYADDVARLGPYRANSRQSTRNATLLGRWP